MSKYSQYGSPISSPYLSSSTSSLIDSKVSGSRRRKSSTRNDHEKISSFLRSENSSYISNNSIQESEPNLEIKHQWSPEVFLPSNDGDLKEFTKYIRHLPKLTINAQDIFGRTLLHLCAELNHSKLTEIVLSNINVNLRIQDYENGWTPLHLALSKGHITVAQMLYAHDFESSYIMDWNKKRPVDLLQSTINPYLSFEEACATIPVTSKSPSRLPSVPEANHSRSPIYKRPYRTISWGTSLLNYGSNYNHNLGFSDGDSKAYPKIVKLERTPEVSIKLMERKIKRIKEQSINAIFHNDEDSSSEEEDMGASNDKTCINPISPSSSSSNKSYISTAAKFFPIQIADSHISKYHSAVLSTDEIGNLFMGGSGKSGKLGLGNDSTHFKFVQIPFFSNKKVLDVALGITHSVALTNDQKVYTWGNNEYGQLGYTPTARVDTIYPEQYTPSEVPIPPVSSAEFLIGVSASKIHTVAYSHHLLIVWGKNVGQMGVTTMESGYVSSVNISPSPSNNLAAGSYSRNTNADDDGAKIQRVPTVYTGFNGTIIQVSACEIATVCLIGHSIHVLMNGENVKIKLPVLPSDSKTKDFGSYQLRTPENGKIVKISTSSKGYVCAIDDIGIVYTFDLKPHYKSPAELENYSNSQSFEDSFSDNTNIKKGSWVRDLRVNVVWKASTFPLIAIDADVADNGLVIICTKEGSVWRSAMNSKQQNKNSTAVHKIVQYPRPGARYQYEQVIMSNRIYRVSCDSLFSAFSLIRCDFKPDPIGVRNSSIQLQFAHLLPDIMSGDLYPMNEYLSLDSFKESFKPFFLRRTINIKNYDASCENLFFKEFPTSRSKLVRCLIGKSHNSMSVSLNNSELKSYVPEPLEKHYDVTVINRDTDDIIGMAHLFFLLARVPEFLKRFPCKSVLYNDDHTIYASLFWLADKQEWVCEFSGVQSSTIKSLLSYIYTGDFFFGFDEFTHPFLQSGAEKENIDIPDDKSEEEILTNLKKEDIRYELYKLNRVLGISDSFYGSIQIKPFGKRARDTQNIIGKQLLNLLGSKFLDSQSMIQLGANVAIRLENNSRTVFLHSYILVTRSSYFASLLSQRWFTDVEEFPDPKIEFICNFPEISLSVFEIIIKYIYGDTSLEAFSTLNGENFGTCEDFLDFVKQVWIAADMLTLDRLSQTCQATLSEFSKLI